MKQTQEMEQTLRAINPNAFLLFSLSKRRPLAPRWLKLENWNDDLLAAQGLQLKSGRGDRAGAARERKHQPGDPSPQGVWEASVILVLGSSCCFGREETGEKLIPHRQSCKLAQAKHLFPGAAGVRPPIPPPIPHILHLPPQV